MTSVIAWLAVDSRQPTALYFASDSRRSFEGKRPAEDDCIKLFVAEGTQEIFAFSGDVTYARTALNKLCNAIEAGHIPGNLALSPYGRSEWIYDFLRGELNSGIRKPEYLTTILYGTRHEWGIKASFSLHAFTVLKDSDRLNCRELSSNLSSSTAIEVNGSGAVSVKNFVSATVKAAGPHSRAYFAAFCNSVMNGDDPYSGGPIQLVGLTCKANAEHYGVVLPTGAFFRGAPYNGSQHVLHWRNDKFEVVTSNGVLRKNAQRHGWPAIKLPE